MTGLTSKQEKQILTKDVPGIATGVAVESAVSKSSDAAAFQTENFFSFLIRFGTAAALAVTNFLDSKKAQKKAEKRQEAKQLSSDVIDAALGELYQAGLALIDAGVSPANSDFDLLMVQNFGQSIGYRGNCNADVLGPPDAQGKRQVWFSVRNGKVSSNGAMLPDNAETKWQVGCAKVRDQWLIVYQQKLVKEGRLVELEALKQRLSGKKLGFQVGFGILVVILVGLAIFNISRMKK